MGEARLFHQSSDVAVNEGALGAGVFRGGQG